MMEQNKLLTQVKIDLLVSDSFVDEDVYYGLIDALIGCNIVYYGMNVSVDSVFKYVKFEHYYNGFTIPEEQQKILNEMADEYGIKKDHSGVHFPGMKAIYIVKLLDKHDIDRNGEEYMFMDTWALSHSEELRKETK